MKTRIITAAVGLGVLAVVLAFLPAGKERVLQRC